MLGLSGCSLLLREAVENVLNNLNYGFFTIKFTLYSTLNPEFKLEISRILEMHIVQDYIKAYCDCIMLSFELLPLEYIQTIENYQDLWCQVEFYNINVHSDEIKDPFLTMNMRVAYSNKRNLYEEFSVGELIPTDQVPSQETHYNKLITVDAQLLDPLIYVDRKIRMNFLARDATMTKAIRFIAKSFKVEKLYLVPPHNTRTYANLFIPPMQDFSKALNYLQYGKGLGVYDSGFCYYKLNDTLYVYPQYETSPESTKVIHVYNVQENSLEGIDGCSRVDDNKILHLLCDSNVVTIDVSESTMENNPTGYLMQKAENLVEGYGGVKNNRLNIFDTGVDLLATCSDIGMSKLTYTPQFITSQGNPHLLRSTLKSYEMNILNFEWKHAIPYSFIPGGKVMFHYDDNKAYRTKSGQVVAVTYSIYRANRFASQMYGCSAKVQMLVGKDPV